MTYKVINIANFDDQVDDYLDNFKDEFESEKAQAMIDERKPQFIAFLKPIFMQEIEDQINQDPAIFKHFKPQGTTSDGNQQYVTDMGVDITIKEVE